MAKVAIIGAGMAGLSAAKVLRDGMKDLGVTLFEASDMIGGRAWTEKIDGEPIDWGCEALEGGKDSESMQALTQFRRGIGGPGERDPWIVKVVGPLETRTFSQELYAAKANDLMGENVRAAARRYGQQQTAARGSAPSRGAPAIADDSITQGVDLKVGAEHIAALLSEYGGSFSESSILGASSAYDRGRAMWLKGELEDEDDGEGDEDHEDDGGGEDEEEDGGQDDEEDDSESGGPYFKEGLGATVCDWADANILKKAGLTQKLSWPVGEVRNRDGDADEVDVVHENGVAVMTFDAVIITVPTPVIASGKLKVKDMTKEQKAAFADCPLGHYHKVAVTGVGPVAGFPKNTRVYVCNEDLEYAFFITASPKGKYFMAHVAGEAAKECNENPQWAKTELIAMLEALKGSKIDRKGLKFFHSSWHDNEYIGGAYSYSKPGKAGAREILSKLSIGRVFFAGEACSLEWYGSLEGAMATGTRAAKRVLKALGA